MKQFLKTGKKALSVFMAIMMLMTAWVWVAPEKASAVNQDGKYNVKVETVVSNAFDIKSGTNMTLKIVYKINNGTNSTTGTYTHTFDDSGVDKNNQVDEVINENVEWFPVSATITGTKNDIAIGWTDGRFTINLYVNGTKVGTGDSGTFSDKDNFSATATTESSHYPTPSSISWVTENAADTADLTIGKTSNVTRTMKFNVFDQYGVRMSSAALTNLGKSPTTSVSGSQSGSIGTSSSNNIYYTLSSSNADAYYLTVTAKPGAKSTTYDSQKITVGASCNGKSLTSRAFNLYDPTYTFTMNPNGGGMITPTGNISKRYHNTFGYTPNATRTGYSLIGFYDAQYDDSANVNNVPSNATPLSSGTYIDSDTEWFAAWQTNQYSMTFKYRDADGNWVTSNPVTEYYGRTIPFPSIENTVNKGVDYTYTFTGWSPAHTIVPDVDNLEYVADYDTVTHYADLSALTSTDPDNKGAIVAAEEKKETDLYKEGAYTDSSVNIFEDTLALAESTVDRKPLMSEQQSVNALTQTLNNAINNLDIKNYTVIFTDEDGSILKDGYFFVPHGSTVTVPQVPSKNYDETNHYSFDCWDLEESDRIEECNYVTDNLIYVAAFAATAHSFTETKTNSTCTADGVITYTCECGYSYTVADSADIAHHTWSTSYKEIVAPTCATVGSEALYCTVCGAIDESSTKEVAKLGHNFGEYTEYTPATCCGEGSEIATCSRCQALDVKKIDQKSHIYGTPEIVEKTCTADGYTKETCSACGFINIRDIDKSKGHTLKVTSVAETCVSVGYAKTYCEKCDFERTTAYPATGVHTYPETWTKVSDASCVGHGVEKRVCTVCNSATETRLTGVAEHTMPADWTVEVPASCDSEGRKVKDCTVCGKELKSEAIVKLGHDYEAYAEGTYAETCTTAGATAEKCSRCGDINTTVIQPTGHTYKKEGAVVTTEATCKEPAYKTYKCDNCGETTKVYVENSTLAAHTWTITKEEAATCDIDGFIKYKCSVCDAEKEEILPKLGHAYPSTWTVEVKATNTVDGKWTRECANCKNVETLTIPAGGHTFAKTPDSWVTASCTSTGTETYKCTAHTGDNACGVEITVTTALAPHTIAQKIEPATCKSEGSVKAYCSVCDVNCEKPFSTTEIPVIAHDFDEGTVVAPTCITSGYTLYTCKANDCGFSYKEYDATKPAIDHTYTGTETTPAGCTTEGVMTYTCTCGDSYTAPISPVGHNYTITENAATCTTAGTKVYTCENADCGNTYTEFVSDTVAHTWGNWTVIQEATTNSYGIDKRECSAQNCDAVEHRTTAPTGAHEFEKKSETLAKCTSEGSIEWECKTHENCEANYTETLDKLPHTQKISYSAPSCTAEGSSKVICSDCSAEIMSETISATGIHDFSGKGEVTTEPTCTDEGTMTYTCKNCTATKVETIPAKGHDLITTVADAKCEEKGKVETTCSRCDDPTVEITTELGAKGHIWKDTYESKVDPTCEKDGQEVYKCQNCEKTNVVVLAKLGHNWGEWQITKASTNNDKGTLTRTCSRGCTETAEIPAGGHNLVEKSRENSTCTNPGSVTYECNVKHEGNVACGLTVTVELPLAQHTIAQKIEPATCKSEGSVKAYCSVCDVNCEKPFSTETIPFKDHVYTAGTAVEPTCTTSGYTPYTCSCGDSYNEYDASKPATGHSLKEGTSTAKCTDGGEMTLTCEKCTYSAKVNVPALGHNYVKDEDKSTSATCAAAATETYNCSRCTSSYTIAVGEKTTKHTYDETKWTVVESSTATSLGYKTNACTVCGQLKVETIPATGEHNFNKETERKNATCTADGYVKYACSTHTDCGLTSTVTLPKLGHTEKLEYSPATCEGKGYARRVCTVESCKAVIENTEIPALGHLYGEGKVTNATCKDTGKIEYSCTRENCGNTKTTTIATNANAHQYETVVTDATCTKEGSVVTKCDLCGKETTNEKLAMLEHTYVVDADSKAAKDATCTEDGVAAYKCNVDGCTAPKTETIAKLGHDWGKWQITKASTNNEKGTLTRTCSRGCTETAEIPAGNHEWDDGTVTKPATCTATGTKVYKCKTHTGENACGVEFTVTLDKLQHELETSKTDATCIKEGSVVTKCSKCDTATITTVIPATGHTFDKVERTDATCTTTGKIVYTCTAKDCGATREVILDKLQHVYEVESTTDATCTASGFTTYKCTDKDCTSKYVEITENAKGHTFVKNSSTATCTDGGKMTLKCACGASMEVDVPALGHNYKLISSTSATCAEGATETYECSGCKDAYTKVVSAKNNKHDWNTWTVVDSTNTSLGYKTRTCKTCEKLELEVIPAKGEHVFDVATNDKLDATCTTDGYIVYDCSVHKDDNDCKLTSKVTLPALGHTEELQYKAASCTEEGYEKRYCTSCNTTLKEEKIAMLDHTYGNEKIKLSDCTNEGEVKFTCTSCKTATKTVVIPVNANAHNLVTETNPATCSREGSVITTCSICKTKLVETTLPKLEHNWGEWVKTNATNSKNGEWKRVCQNNSEHFETVEIPAGGHSFDTSVPNSTTAAKCNVQGTATYNCTAHESCGVTITVNTGYAEHTYNTVLEKATCEKSGLVTTSCTVCDKVSIATSIPATGHSYSGKVTTKPTCTAPGEKTYTCAHDSKHTYIEEIAPLGHDYVKQGEATEATCKTPSTESYKCSRCEDAFTKYVSGTVDHSWNDTWTTVIEPTTDKNGIKKTTCSVCDEEKYETIAPIGDHEFKEKIIKNATCKDVGEKSFTCQKHENCSANYTAVIPVIPHAQKVVYTPSTCTTEGSTKVICGNEGCGAVIVEEAAIPVVAHNYTNGTVTKDATCKDEGTKTYTCSCGATRTEVIPKTEHKISVTVNDATCKEKGSVITACENKDCDYKIVVELAVKGHVWNTTAQSTTAATCTADGSKVYKCLYCDETNTVILSKLGHSWGEWKVETIPTDKNPGYQQRGCSRCGVYEVVKIPPYGEFEHHFIVIEEKAPTCTTNGYITKVCTDANCGYTEKTIIKALGHTLTYTSYLEPTCTLDGNYAYYHCSRCEKNFEDRAARYQMTNVVIGKLYHSVVVIPGFEATCTTDGMTDYSYCTRCEYTQPSTPITAYGHQDADGNGACDYCDGAFTNGGSFICTCSCHKTGFLNELIYKIIKFFWKLLGKSKECECGVIHY